MVIVVDCALNSGAEGGAAPGVSTALDLQTMCCASSNEGNS
jgi:hypothetical protein